MMEITSIHELHEAPPSPLDSRIAQNVTQAPIEVFDGIDILRRVLSGNLPVDKLLQALKNNQRSTNHNDFLFILKDSKLVRFEDFGTIHTLDPIIRSIAYQRPVDHWTHKSDNSEEKDRKSVV